MLLALHGLLVRQKAPDGCQDLERVEVVGFVAGVEAAAEPWRRPQLDRVPAPRLRLVAVDAVLTVGDLEESLQRLGGKRMRDVVARELGVEDARGDGGLLGGGHLRDRMPHVGERLPIVTLGTVDLGRPKGEDEARLAPDARRHRVEHERHGGRLGVLRDDQNPAPGLADRAVTEPLGGCEDEGVIGGAVGRLGHMNELHPVRGTGIYHLHLDIALAHASLPSPGRPCGRRAGLRVLAVRFVHSSTLAD